MSKISQAYTLFLFIRLCKLLKRTPKRLHFVIKAQWQRSPTDQTKNRLKNNCFPYKN